MFTDALLGRILTHPSSTCSLALTSRRPPDEKKLALCPLTESIVPYLNAFASNVELLHPSFASHALRSFPVEGTFQESAKHTMYLMFN